MTSISNLIKNPHFFPDATRGVLKTIDSTDLQNTSTKGIVVNTYHLLFSPGSDILAKAGGIKKFMSYDGFVISDSGGFQVFSLIRKNKKFGTMADEGINLTAPNSPKIAFTPEMCIDTQFKIGSDIMICLDDCPKMDASRAEIEVSVERTIAWAKRCKDRFEDQVQIHNLANKPLLFAVIQGGAHKDLRKRCAEELLEIGFDGFGFGGWPMTRTNELDSEYLNYVSSLIPHNKPKYALGVGLPHEIAKCTKMGYKIFDCVLPTRDARHKRLYVFNEEPLKLTNLEDRGFFSYIYINKKEFEQDFSPISTFCRCYTCQNYSRAYINHLFRIKDVLALRLATIHNLFFYSSLMRRVSDLYSTIKA
ncbi:MAG: tRNA guanosine(34) transglycosylase Tgt [Patescibacteria group bacterium]